MIENNSELNKVYEEYYGCSNSFCDSIYHVSNFNVKNFSCRDCGKESEIPEEAKKKAKDYK